LPKSNIEQMVRMIWNKSVKQITDQEIFDISLNKYIAFEEAKTFSSKKMLEDIIMRELPEKPDEKLISEIKTLFEEENLILREKYFNLQGLNIYDELYINTRCTTAFDIASFIEYLGDKTSTYTQNIQRIIKLWECIKNKKWKMENLEDFEYLYNFQIEEKSYNFGFPARLLVLVEGNTEETLLPLFCEKAGFDFNSNGIHLIGAGGKNQILKIYNDIKDKISIPVFMLLDKDGIDVEGRLENIIKPKDTYFIIEEGEFEDILKPELICRGVNNYYKVERHISIDEINNNIPKTKLFHHLWKEKGFEEFSKSAFAKIIAENIKEINDISTPLMKIIRKIENLLLQS
jgi:hypothetical protein